MSNVAIKVEKLGKKYVINHEKGNGDDNFREVIIGNTKKILTSLNPFSKPSKNEVQKTTEDFWALNDVSFEINKGDKVGIIGRNGAGKSTLLKVLSRITEPTTGKIHINGRIASLLEVGTGFHPELTGRENIYLNGAILGMGRKEIKAKFDEIVAFAEIEKFLDTPVKRYSSGMYVRLAFSVAAHLEPEILVVDEVLAVGDAAFQKKCLGKMNDVSENGRTIIFVSHNIAAISILCEKAILLEGGRLSMFDKTDKVLEAYRESTKKHHQLFSIAELIEQLPNDKTLKILGIELIQAKRPVSTIIENGKDLYVRLVYEVKEPTTDLRIFLDYKDENGVLLFRTFCNTQSSYRESEIGKYISEMIIPKDFLAPKEYFISIRAGVYKKRYILPPDALTIPISVKQTGSYNIAYAEENIQGILAIVFNWTTTKLTIKRN